MRLFRKCNLLWFVVNIFPTISASNLAVENCFLDDEEPEKDAVAVISVLLDIRQKLQSSGEPSCGSLTREGIQVAEAAKWAVQLLNQDSGEVFGGNVADSFIPGIKLGLRIMDACGMKHRAVQLATQNLHHLYAPRHCCVFNETRVSLGVISNIERGGMNDIAEFLWPYGKPILSLLPETRLLKGLDVLSIIPSAETVASRRNHFIEFEGKPAKGDKKGLWRSVQQAIVRAAQRLRLQNIWLIYENTDYGRDGRDFITRLANALRICLLGMDMFQREKQSNGEIETTLEKVLSYYPEPVCIILFMARPAALSFLKAAFSADEMGHKSSRVEWVLSDGFDGSFVELFGKTNGIFTVTDENPHRIPEFLDYWNGELSLRSSNSRLREYYQEKARCRLPGDKNPAFIHHSVCKSLNPTLGQVDPDLYLTPSIVSIIDAVLAYATALKGAWMAKCHGRPGLCPGLVQMANREFRKHLKHVQFTHSRDSRSPPSLYGREVSQRRRKDRVAVFQGQYDSKGSLLLKQIFRISKSSLSRLSAPYLVNPSSYRGNESSSAFHRCINLEMPQHSMHIIPGDVYFVLMAKISRPGADALERCGNIESQGGLIFAESFLYGIQRIAKRVLPNVTIGAVVIDTCSNAINAIRLLSYGSRTDVDPFDDGRPEGHRFDPSSVLAVLIQQDEDIAYSEFAKLMSATLKQWPIVSVGRHMIDGKEVNLYDTGTSVEVMLDASFYLAAKANWSCVHLVVSGCYAHLRDKIETSAAYMNISTASISWLVEEPGETNGPGFNSTLSLMLAQPTVAGVMLLLSPLVLERFLHDLNYSTMCSNFTFIAVKDTVRPLGLSSDKDGCVVSLEVMQQTESSFEQFIAQRRIGSKHQLPEPWMKDYISSVMGCTQEFSHEQDGSTHRHCSDDSPLYETHGPDFDEVAVNRLFEALLRISVAVRTLMVKLCASPGQAPCKEFFRNLTSKVLPHVRAEAFRIGQVDWSEVSIQIPGLRLRFVARRGSGSVSKLVQVAEFDPATKRISISNFAEFQGIFARKSECTRVALADMHLSHEIMNSYVLPPLGVPLALPSFATPNSATPGSSQNILYVPSSLGESRLFIGVLLPLLGASGNNVLDCSADPQDRGVILLEAVLWAVEKLEKAWNFSINLLILNTCGSAVKTDIVLQSLLNEPRLLLEPHVASKLEKGRIIGFINDPTVGPAMVASQILSEASIINVDISGHLMGDSIYAVDLSHDLRVYAYAVADFLSLNGMKIVSLLYSKRKTLVQVADFLRLKIAEKGLCVMASIELDVKLNCKNALEQMFTAKRQGSNATIVLADHDALRTLGNSLAEHSRESADLLLILLILPGEDDAEKINFLSTRFGGSVLLMSNVSVPAEFFTHLSHLHYQRGTSNRNIWWRRFWERTYNCTPAKCHQVQVPQNPYDGLLSVEALLFMNAISALFHGAHVLERKLCLKSTSQCEEMVRYDKFGSEIVEAITGGEFATAYDLSWPYTASRGRLPGANLTFYLLSTAGTEKIPTVNQATSNENTSSTGSHVVSAFRSPTLPTEYQDSQTCKDSSFSFCDLLNTSSQLHAKSGCEEDDEMTGRTVSVGNAYRREETGQPSEFACLFSNHQIYVFALLPVHGRGHKPLTCDSFSSDSYQQWQAIRWSVERLNHFMFAEMGITLGALGVDSCSDEIFGLRQIFSLMHSGAEPCITGNISDRIVAAVLISPEDADAYVATTRLFSESSIPVFNIGSLTTEPRDGLLSLAIATSFETIAKSMVSLASAVQWSYVGFVYTESDLGFQKKLIFNAQAKDADVCIHNFALSNIGAHECERWQSALGRLFTDLSTLSENGLRAVVLDIPDFALRCFLQHMENFVSAGSFRNDLFTFVTTLGENFKEVFANFEPLAVGFVIFHPPAVQLKQFSHYWNGLPQLDIVDDVWWPEYLMGFGEPAAQGGKLLRIINSVYAIGHSLRLTWKSQCDQCTDMQLLPSFRTTFWQHLKTARFIDETNRMFEFKNNRVASEVMIISLLIRSLDILQWVQKLLAIDGVTIAVVLHIAASLEELRLENAVLQSVSKAPEVHSKMLTETVYLFQVGHIANGKINTSATEIPPFKDFSPLLYLKSLKSSCEDHDICKACFPEVLCMRTEQPVSRTQEVTATTAADSVNLSFAPSSQCNDIVRQPLKPNPEYSDLAFGPRTRVLIYSKDQTYILVVFPLKLLGGSACADADGSHLFKQLNSLLYAVRALNKKLNGQGEVGLLADHADDLDAGLAQIHLAVSNRSQQIIAVINVGFLAHHGMAKLAEVFKFPLINIHSVPLVEPRNQWDIGLGVEAHGYAMLFCTVVKELDVGSVNIFHEINELFLNILTVFHLCLSRSGIDIYRTITFREHATEEKVLNEFQTLSSNPWKVVILLLGPYNLCSIHRLVGHAEAVSTSLTFIGIGLEEPFSSLWPYEEKSQLKHTWISIETRVGLDTGFANYMTSLTLDNHEPTPSSWFEAFWERQFSCSLGGENGLKNKLTPCTGYERLHPLMFETMGSEGFLAVSVGLLYKAIRFFNREICNISADTPKRMFDCFKYSDRLMWLSAVQNTEPESALEALLPTNTSHCKLLARQMVFLNGRYTFETVASSQEGVKLYSFASHEAYLFDGNLCMDIRETSYLDKFNHSLVLLPGHFEDPMVQEVLLAVIISVAGIGMTICLVTALGFLIYRSGPGSSILPSCIILLGLFVVYLSSLAFVFEPTEFICSARVFLSGIPWVIVFAPMLLKVMLNRLETDEEEPGPLRIPSCYVILFTFVLAIIQAIIIFHWVAFGKVTLDTEIYAFANSSKSNGMWRCAQVGILSSDTAIVFTFFYPMLLVLLTILFGLTGSKQEHYVDNGSILSASVVTMVNWLLLACLAMTLPHWLRDLSMAIGLTGNATAVFVCLFLNSCCCRSKSKGQTYELDNEGRSNGTEVLSVDMVACGAPWQTAMFNGHMLVPNSQVDSKSVQNASCFFAGEYGVGSEFSPGSFH